MPTPKKSDEPYQHSGDFGRGIFTDADRRFLLKDNTERQEDYHRSSRLGRWNSIHDRLSAGLVDLKNCIHQLPDDRRRAVYQDLFPPENTARDVPFRITSEAIGFLLLGMMEVYNEDLDNKELLEKVIENSIYRMIRASDRRSGLVVPDGIEVEIDGFTDIREWERDADPSELPEEYLDGLYAMGELTQEEFARAVLSDELDGVSDDDDTQD